MDQFKDLLKKYLNDALTTEELQHFMLLVQQSDNQELVRQAVSEVVESGHFIDLSVDKDIDIFFERVMQRAAVEEKNELRAVSMKKYWWAAAAVLLMTVAATIYLSIKNRQPENISVIVKNDIPPGKEGAILTLADGSKVVLDSLGSGLIATQSGTEVKLANGQLVYDPKAPGMGDAVENMMSTPRGRQFQLQLPDGTKVWLNAASSIRFPAVFRGNRRSVSITGEVYFEVTANKDQPFYVNVDNKVEIAVLGTKFNVNGYSNNESIKTTLLDGAVLVNAGSSMWLKPGQQAILAKDGALQLHKADIGRTMSWKNGHFNFEGLSFREAMQQLERWYDISIDIKDEMPGFEFYGEISRNISLSDMISILEDMGVYLKIESGRKLIVLPEKPKN